MKAWRRWQDWIALVAGVYALLSPLWTDTDTAAMWSLIVFGALIALASLASLARPEMDPLEYAHAALGALLFIAPWVLGYADMMGAAWTSWIAGIVTLVVGVAALPMTRNITGGRAAPQH
ncbi:MAG TPA: SPW repeat protein [Nocardioidaceae bacterium]|nr:SPW repeat protein [Nocardioidaceae bacterium]